MRQPPEELVGALLPMFGPCPAFIGRCAGYVTWDPEHGHVPRGFRGGFGLIEDIRLILVVAETGDPYVTERHPAHVQPIDYLRRVYNSSSEHVEHKVDLFARNVRVILDFAWPGLSFEEQMRRTWITESVFCSAAPRGRSCSHIRRDRVHEPIFQCASRTDAPSPNRGAREQGSASPVSFWSRFLSSVGGVAPGM